MFIAIRYVRGGVCGKLGHPATGVARRVVASVSCHEKMEVSKRLMHEETIFLA